MSKRMPKLKNGNWLLLLFRDITKSADEGGVFVSENKYDELVRKVQQHEETITQLVEIIAATNRRVSELDRMQCEQTHTFSLT